jgi:hypothetical protein
MPVVVRPWEIALKHLAGYHTARPEDGGHYNYWLPPARCLLSPQSDEKKAKLFTGWLRIRELCLFLLSDSKCSPFRLSNKEWRTLLLVCGGCELDEDGGTRNANHRHNVRERLERALQRSDVQLDVQNLFTKSVQWKGIEINGLPDTNIAREILWELCELNFRSDFVALDRQMDESAVSALERQEIVDRCWNGTAAYIDLLAMRSDLGERSVFERAAFVKALHTAMKTWRGAKPDVLLESFPDNSQAHNFPNVVNRIEQNLANVYVDSFLAAFGRAASIPYVL